jgi:ferredoxin
MHCQVPSCMTGAVDGAVVRRPDGIVLIDPVKAKGQESIAKACPYRVIFWNAEKQIPQKCTLCAHRLDQGEKQPRCVESCPTGALLFGDLDDPTSDIARQAGKGEVLHPEFGTRPRVTYLGLPKRMVAGEVLFKDQPGECAANVRIQLDGGGHHRELVTDAFGDFLFDGLNKQTAYRLSIQHPGYAPQQIEVETRRDVNLGQIVLEPRQ